MRIIILLALLINCYTAYGCEQEKQSKGSEPLEIVQSLNTDEIRFILELNQAYVQVPSEFEKQITTMPGFKSLVEKGVLNYNTCVKGFAGAYSLSEHGNAVYEKLIDVAVNATYEAIQKP